MQEFVEVELAPPVNLPESTSIAFVTPTVETYFKTPTRVTTSFNAETPVVKALLHATERQSPKIIYEDLQNKFDYHNPELGFVEVSIYFKDGRTIPFQQFIELTDDEIDALANQVAYYQSTNCITEDAFYEPEHLWQIRHAGGGATLGQHGQGGSASFEALVSKKTHHASIVEVVSRDQHGSWKALMQEEPTAENQTCPDLTIYFERTDDTVDQTCTRVWDPSPQFLKTLRHIPQEFLLANPDYEFYQMGESVNGVPNILTVMVVAEPGSESPHFTSDELQFLGYKHEGSRYPPRVEILPTIPQDTIKTIFVDGIRLNDYKNFALPWSAWGFRNGDHWSGGRISRSSDSMQAEGRYNQLLSLALCKCKSTQVFERLFGVAGDISSIDRVFELSLPINLQSPEAEGAFSTAWQNYSVNHQLTPDTVVTSSPKTYHDALAKGEKAQYLSSTHLVSELKRLRLIPSTTEITSTEVYDRLSVTLARDNQTETHTNSAMINMCLPLETDGELHLAENVIKAYYPQFKNDVINYSDIDPHLRSAIEKLFALQGEDIVVSLSFATNEKTSAFELRAKDEGPSTAVTIKKLESADVAHKLGLTLWISPASIPPAENVTDFVGVVTEKFKAVTSDGAHLDQKKFQQMYLSDTEIMSQLLAKQEAELRQIQERIAASKREAGIPDGGKARSRKKTSKTADLDDSDPATNGNSDLSTETGGARNDPTEVTEKNIDSTLEQKRKELADLQKEIDNVKAQLSQNKLSKQSASSSGSADGSEATTVGDSPSLPGERSTTELTDRERQIERLLVEKEARLNELEQKIAEAEARLESLLPTSTQQSSSAVNDQGPTTTFSNNTSQASQPTQSATTEDQETLPASIPDTAIAQPTPTIYQSAPDSGQNTGTEEPQETLSSSTSDTSTAQFTQTMPLSVPDSGQNTNVTDNQGVTIGGITTTTILTQDQTSLDNTAAYVPNESLHAQLDELLEEKRRLLENLKQSISETEARLQSLTNVSDTTALPPERIKDVPQYESGADDTTFDPIFDRILDEYDKAIADGGDGNSEFEALMNILESEPENDDDSDSIVPTLQLTETADENPAERMDTFPSVAPTPQPAPADDAIAEDGAVQDELDDMENQPIHLFHPDANSAASMNKDPRRKNQEETDESITLEGLLEKLDSELKKLESPPIQLLRPLQVPPRLRNTILSTVNPKFSGKLERQQVHITCSLDIESPGTRINNPVNAGIYAVPIIPEHQMIGWYHPDKNVAEKIQLSYCQSHGIYVMVCEEDLPPGFEFYFALHDNSISSIHQQPTVDETQPLTEMSLLNHEWQSLVYTINGDLQLTGKQKADIVLATWIHAFTYLDDKHLDLPKNISPAQRYATIINTSRGNCGYAAEGWITLQRLCGLPAGAMIGYLGDNGGYFPGGQNHEYGFTYLDGRRVIVEPQAEYLSPGYVREEIPEKYKQLIRAIPMGKRNLFTDPDRGNERDWQEIADKISQSGLAENSEVLQRARQLAQKQAELDEIFTDPFDGTLPVPGGRPVDYSRHQGGSPSAIDILMNMISQQAENVNGNQLISPEAAQSSTKHLLLLGYLLGKDAIDDSFGITPERRIALQLMLEQLRVEPNQELLSTIIQQLILGNLTHADKIIDLVNSARQAQQTLMTLMQIGRK